MLDGGLMLPVSQDFSLMGRMLDVLSADLMKLAVALSREADRIDMRCHRVAHPGRRLELLPLALARNSSSSFCFCEHLHAIR